MPECFIPRLQEAMQDKKIKPKKLCAILKLSHNTVYEWINGYRVMNAVNFFELCAFLEVNPMWMYGLSDEKHG